MRNLKTIENRVLAVLKEHPEARNDEDVYKRQAYLLKYIYLKKKQRLKRLVGQRM